MTEVVELVPDRLYRLGGTAPIDGRLSWRPTTMRGHEPLSAYLLLEESKALLVGTGVRLHRQLIVDQVRSLLGGRELQLYVGRNEADEIGNLAALTTEFGIKRIWWATAGHLLRWFEHDDLGGEIPDTEITFLLPPDSPGRRIILEERPSGVEFSEQRPLRLLHTRLSTLGSTWLYDEKTRTLFSSDFFSEAAMADPSDGPVLAGTDAHSPSRAQVEEHIFTRFYWMRQADTAPLVANLDAITDRKIDRICPYHGRVIEGRELVAHHIALTREVLNAVTVPGTR